MKWSYWGKDNRYRVSTTGIVQTRVRRGTRSDELLSEWKNKVTAETQYGYRSFSVCENGKTKQVLLHRVLAILFIPNPENKPQIDHIDGDKQNNSLENLRWVTPKENILNAVRNVGRIGAFPFSKFDEIQLITAITLINNKRSNREVAKYLGVDCSVVSRLKTKDTYRHFNHLVEV